MPDHPLTAVGAAASLYVQETEPTETPQPAPDGDGAFWYPTKTVVTDLDSVGWTFDAGVGVQSGVAIDDGKLFIGDEVGDLHALNLSDGTREWKGTANDRIRSGVVVKDGVVYFGSKDTALYAYNVADGSEKWSSSAASDSWVTDLAISNGVIVGGNRDSNIYGIDTADGGKVWEFATGSDVRADVAIENGTVVGASDDGNVYGINLADGQQLWSYTPGQAAKNGIEIYNGIAVVGTENATAVGLDITDGAEKYVYNGVDNGVSSGIIIDSDGVAYFGDRSGNAHAIDAVTGNEVFNSNVADTTIECFSPTLTEDAVVFGALDGSTTKYVIAVNRTDGSVKWTYDTGDTVNSGIVSDSTNVYLGSNSNLVYEFEQSTTQQQDGNPRVSNGTEWITTN